MGFKDLPGEFFGNHYERAKRNYELATAREKVNFQQKYPYANVEDFFFDADIARDGDVVNVSVKYKKARGLSDITGYIFRKNYEEALHWQPRIWGPEGTTQKLVANTDPFPYNVAKFNIYVTKDEYFSSDFQGLSITWKGTEKDIRKVAVDENDPYFCSLLSACVISHVGGVSRKHPESRNEHCPVLRFLPPQEISERPRQIGPVSDRRFTSPRKEQLARAKNLEAQIFQDERKYKSVVLAARKQGEHQKLPVRLRQRIQRGYRHRVRGSRSRALEQRGNRLDVVRQRKQRRTHENRAKVTADGHRVLRLRCSRVASADEMAGRRTGREVPADARHLPRARERQHRAGRSREKY